MLNSADFFFYSLPFPPVWTYSKSRKKEKNFCSLAQPSNNNLFSSLASFSQQIRLLPLPAVEKCIHTDRWMNERTRFRSICALKSDASRLILHCLWFHFREIDTVTFFSQPPASASLRLATTVYTILGSYTCSYLQSQSHCIILRELDDVRWSELLLFLGQGFGSAEFMTAEREKRVEQQDRDGWVGWLASCTLNWLRRWRRRRRCDRNCLLGACVLSRKNWVSHPILRVPEN